tara:strand:- start:227 stop:478 length:252 start_codon:yes stop_codon:yes gene_type:complete
MSDSIKKYYELVEEGKINESTKPSNPTVSKSLVIKRINAIKDMLLFRGSKSGLSDDDSVFMATRSINVLIDDIKSDNLSISNC